MLSVQHTTRSILSVRDSATNFSNLALVTAASNSNLGNDTVFVGTTLDLDMTRWVEI